MENLDHIKKGLIVNICLKTCCKVIEDERYGSITLIDNNNKELCVHDTYNISEQNLNRVYDAMLKTLISTQRRDYVNRACASPHPHKEIVDKYWRRKAT